MYPKALSDLWGRGSDLQARGSGLAPTGDVPGLSAISP